MENNIVNFSNKPNPHILTYGQSGQGKTFFCCRRVEEAIKANKTVLILDYSGSYTEKQLSKNHFRNTENIESFDVAKNPFVWITCFQDAKMFSDSIEEALCTILGIDSYFQRKWLGKAIVQYLGDSKVFRVNKFIEMLEDMYIQERDRDGFRDDIDNINRLLSRLAPYSKIENFIITNHVDVKDFHKKVIIIQTSYLSVRERYFVTAMIIELLWKEVAIRSKKPRYNMIVLDEFQFLSLAEDSSLTNILREGRKCKLEVLLSTQFISSYKKDSLETLMQVGHIVIFKPSPTDMRFSVNILDNENKQAWRTILNRLNCGEAVVKGSFYLKDNSVLIEGPIICKV